LEVIATLKYEKRREIGGRDGQNSRVFLAFDHHLGAELVVKEVEKRRIGDAARYFAEARAVHASAHPRVVPVRWAGQTDDHVCIAMPMMRGGSLADAIRSKPLRPTEVIRIGQDLCEGVAQVHIAKFIHLDIKPTNVLFDENQRAAITDFGLALELDALGTADARDQALYPSFLPPEVMRTRGVVTMASDVYQIGLTLYRTVNGEPFFADQWERMRSPWPAGRTAIMEGRFPDRSFLPSVPLRLRQVIVRALSLDPALRQVGARQLAHELASIEVKHDWEVEGYAADAVTWRLRQPGRADVLVLQRGAPPGTCVEIWTDGATGRRRKEQGAWSPKIRTRSQLKLALSRAFRAATT
jgi:serine/threonine protein kinase